MICNSFVSEQLRNSSTIRDVKRGVQRLKGSLYPDRQSVRLEAKGKTLKDDETLQSLGLKNGSRLYIKVWTLSEKIML